MTPDITAALIALILQSTDITAKVGSRVISDFLPQKFDNPSIVLWVISERALDAIDGPLGMDQPIFRIECYAQQRREATELRLLLRDHIGGFAGVVSDVFIKGIAQERGQAQRVDRVRRGTDEYQFVAAQDFRVSYNSIPDPVPGP